MKTFSTFMTEASVPPSVLKKVRNAIQPFLVQSKAMNTFGAINYKIKNEDTDAVLGALSDAFGPAFQSNAHYIFKSDGVKITLTKPHTYSYGMNRFNHVSVQPS